MPVLLLYYCCAQSTGAEVSFLPPFVNSSLTRCRRHVFKDLRPYVCLQYGCAEAEYEFAHRRDWISHTRHCHCTGYSCPLDSCAQRFPRPSMFQQHVEAAHANEKSRYDMSTLMSRAVVEKVNEPGLVCPFCRKSHRTAKAHYRHVGRHMEELACFALPLPEIRA